MCQSTQDTIEKRFRTVVGKDPRIRNAYLLVNCEKRGIHLNMAAGQTGDKAAHPDQPNYMASVGKLYTASLVARLHEQGALSFEDPIATYLDRELMDGLHIYKGTDYSSQIKIRHLLNQSSGLPDNFYPLFEKLEKDPSFTISPRDAVLWAKENLNPSAPPGKRSSYTDTNYHLLGLIVEKVTDRAFHEALHEQIFEPLGLNRSSFLHASQPAEDPGLPIAEFYKDDLKINDLKGFTGIDYAGGGVVAPLEEVFTFMHSLINGEVVSRETLQRMLSDKMKLYPGFNYGYATWQVKPVPLIFPKKYRSWGVLGATGAFSFYHPELESYFVGNFNHSVYQRKAVRFMFKVMNEVWKNR
ncbi:MAG: serine hydrolase domain-containing protein [Bacteroidota bacterium]